jgi:Coenzyme A transferase
MSRKNNKSPPSKYDDNITKYDTCTSSNGDVNVIVIVIVIVYPSSIQNYNIRYLWNFSSTTCTRWNENLPLFAKDSLFRSKITMKCSSVTCTRNSSTSQNQTTNRRRSSSSKVVASSREALDGLNVNGITIAIGGFGTCGVPETLINELAKI